MLHLRARATALAVALLVGTAGCKDAGSLTLANFAVAPSPAQPGDAVQAEFLLSISPLQPFTVTVFIGGVEHARVDRDTPSLATGPVQVQLGDAADLIDQYGTGFHAVVVEVRTHQTDTFARTGAEDLELQGGA